MTFSTARGYQSQGWLSGHALKAVQPEDRPCSGRGLPG